MSTQKLLVAIDLALAMAQRFTALTSVIQAARADGRDELNDTEWAAVLAADDQADTRLAGLIEEARAAGR